nr:IS630 family transposase [Brevibacterium sp. UCMA 11754]
MILHGDDESILREGVRASTIKAGLARRARIVLLAADGLPTTRIADLTGSSVVTVLKWRERFAEAGIAGLGDDPRSGRPKQLDHFDIVTTTLVPPPKKYGATHWSSRLLGKHLKVGNATVARAWREYGVQPWKAEIFKFYTDSELDAKVTDVIGLYLAPPDNAVVLSVDENSQIQALDRTAPLPPMRMGDAEKRTRDYHRRRTPTQFVALDVATGQVTGAVKPRHQFLNVSLA